MAEKEKPLPFKETAGTLTAFLVVLAFVAIGFTAMAATAFLGIDLNVPGDWMAAMLSLASAALGYLIGKNDMQTPLPVEPAVPYAGDAFRVDGEQQGPCPHCGLPLDAPPTPPREI